MLLCRGWCYFRGLGTARPLRAIWPATEPTPPAEGLWPAVEDFLLEAPEWRLWQHYPHNNGLTVLRRVALYRSGYHLLNSDRSDPVVIAGIAAANHVDESPSWPAMIGALVVALALVAGVNYANDYSDGIRGTDDNRVGPQRLVGSGAASPGAVRTAAIIAFLIAAVAGVWLSLATHWWLILVGAVCILAAWFYTGGSRPYGYAGFGEIAVFVFFGLVAVCGTQLVVGGRIDSVGVGIAIAIGSFASAILVTNNLRDIDSDAAARMDALLQVLPEKQREILILRVVVGLSAEETAEAVGSTAGAVRVAQHRALAKLRTEMTVTGYDRG